jgi:hypothetical protein
VPDAASAEHLTYTPDDEIRAVGGTDTVAVLLPQAELIYMTDRRANARLFIDQECLWRSPPTTAPRFTPRRCP